MNDDLRKLLRFNMRLILDLLVATGKQGANLKTPLKSVSGLGDICRNFRTTFKFWECL